jgi:hypothetical protein
MEFLAKRIVHSRAIRLSYLRERHSQPHCAAYLLNRLASGYTKTNDNGEMKK